MLSFILNLTMYCAVRPWNPEVEKNIIVTRDPAGYEMLAENIMHYHSFAGSYDTTQVPVNSPLLKASYLMIGCDSYREPAYPAFLALVYCIFGVKPFIAIFIQLLLSTLSVVLVYRVAMLLLNSHNVAILAALLVAIDIHSIYVANTLLSDTLFVFLFLFSLYYFLSGLQMKSLFRFVVSAIFMGIACLTRPVLLIYPFILVFFLLLFYRKSGMWLLKAMVLFMVIIYSALGFWAFRNYSAYGRWQLTTMNGCNLLMYNVAITESRMSLKSIGEVRTELDKQCDELGCSKIRNPFIRSEICQKVAWEYIKKNKIAYIETQVWGGFHMFLSLGNIDIAQHLGWNINDVEGQVIMDSHRLKQNFSHIKLALLGILIILMLAIQYTGAICGFYFLVKQKRYRVFFFSILTILYFTMVTGAIGKYRYKLPMQVLICSISGFGYCSLFSKYNAGRMKISPDEVADEIK